MRLHLILLKAIGVIAPLPMTAFFLLIAFQANQSRLRVEPPRPFHQSEVSHSVGAKRLLRLAAETEPPGVGHVAFAAPIVAKAKLSQGPRVSMNYKGSVLTVGDEGRDITLNGRSIDQMDRQDLLRQIHQFGKRLMEQSRPLVPAREAMTGCKPPLGCALARGDEKPAGAL